MTGLSLRHWRVRLPGHCSIRAVARRLRISQASVRAKIRGSLKASWHSGELVVSETDLAAYQRACGEGR